MLHGLEPERYCLISQGSSSSAEPAGEHTQKLAAKYYNLPAAFQLTRGHRFGLSVLRSGVNIPLAVLKHARAIAKVLREERCEAVVACTGIVSDLPAAYFASRLVGVPFFAWVFDDYTHREWQDPAARFWAARFEPYFMRGAAGVIAPNEVLADDLRNRHGVDVTVIHNSLDLSAYNARHNSVGQNDGEVRIIYTGDVYEAHYDAFVNLVAAIRMIGRPDLKLHLYTSRSAAALAERGISGPVVVHPPLALAGVPQIQEQADLLFLPLAFKSPYPELVRTSATTKLGEYLAARRPIIVHAPPDSFVSWYFRRYECGVVVDRLDQELLAQAVGAVLGDAGLRLLLAERAWERACKDFSLEAAREQFIRLLEKPSHEELAHDSARGLDETGKRRQARAEL